MNNRHIILSGLMTLLVTIAIITMFAMFVLLHEPSISIVSITLLIIGLAAGALIPSIVTTWLVLLLSVVGVAILFLGNVPMALPAKLILLAAFPVGVGIMSIDRYVVIKFGWAKFNRHDIERYFRHYDPVTKLQTLYNADKIYGKTVRFIRNDYDGALWLTVTAIHWAHNAQFKQFHANSYNQALKAIATVLKTDRLPSESLYYIGDGTFLIVSHRLSNDIYQKLAELTNRHLRDIKLLKTTAQFTQGRLRIDHSNVDDFPTLADVTSHLQREMETDLVVEYLSGGTD